MKKILAMVLAAVMVVCAMPVGVAAADDPEGLYVKIYYEEYNDMQIIDDGTLAFDTLDNYENIQCIEIYYYGVNQPTDDQKKLNIQINDNYEIGKLIIGQSEYDTYGYYGCDVTLSGTGSLTCHPSDTYDSDPVYVGTGSSLTIDGPSVTVIAADDITTSNDSPAYSYGVKLENSTLTVSSGELIAMGSNASSNYVSYSVGIFAEDNSTITINGGEVTATGDAASSNFGSYSAGIFAKNESTLSINGGKVTATGGDTTGDTGASAGLLAVYSNVTIGSDAKILFQGEDSALKVMDDEYKDADEEDFVPSTVTINGAVLLPEDIADLSANKTFEQSPRDDDDASGTPDLDEEPTGFNVFMMLLMRMAQIDTLITGEGTVTHDGTSRMAMRGKVRTYTITPADGWMISDVIYAGESLGAVDSVEIVPEARRSTIEVIFTEITEETEE